MFCQQKPELTQYCELIHLLPTDGLAALATELKL